MAFPHGCRLPASTSKTCTAALLPTRATGEFGYSVRNGEQRFSANARNTLGLAVSAEAEATLRAQVLELSTARLRLGEGRADLRGRLELHGQRALQLTGSFTSLDLAQAVRGVDTRLNGTFEVRGQLQTPLAGQLGFALSDSRIAGRNVSGRGRVTLADRLFDADVDIQSATARLIATGGLGGGRELRLELNAPDIESLLPGYRGRITSQVIVKGELDALRLTGFGRCRGSRPARRPSDRACAGFVCRRTGGERAACLEH